MEAEQWKELCQRSNETGARFVMTEIDVTGELMAKLARMPKSKEKKKGLKEARARVESTARFARGIEFPGSGGEEVWKRIAALREELERIGG